MYLSLPIELCFYVKKKKNKKRKEKEKSNKELKIDFSVMKKFNNSLYPNSHYFEELKLLYESVKINFAFYITKIFSYNKSVNSPSQAVV